MFIVTIAFANGLVALGLMMLLRAGLVSFGQALYYCLGAYAAGVLHDLSGSYYAGFAFSLCCIGLAALPFWRSEAALRPAAD